MSDIFLKVERDYHPASEAISMATLPPGVYHLNYDPDQDKMWFTQFDIRSDELVDLPGTAYDLVVQDLQMFLTPNCKTRHEQVNILHKMNILLYGPPGTGKSCLVNRVVKETVNAGGVVLFNPNPRVLKKAFALFDKLQPETRMLIIFEELDQLLDDHDEDAFLHILDGELQKPNAMYIATTNYINEVPLRIRRPGRFALRIEVGFPGMEARVAYLNSKLKDKELVQNLAEATAGFSVDNLKEVVRSGFCMQKDYYEVIKSLREEFNITNDGPQNPNALADDGGSNATSPFMPSGKRRGR